MLRKILIADDHDIVHRPGRRLSENTGKNLQTKVRSCHPGH
jgi:hypothetical protein